MLDSLALVTSLFGDYMAGVERGWTQMRPDARGRWLRLNGRRELLVLLTFPAGLIVLRYGDLARPSRPDKPVVLRTHRMTTCCLPRIVCRSTGPGHETQPPAAVCAQSTVVAESIHGPAVLTAGWRP